ncbi:GNAT family N-acetyltransferase [Streptococcus zalophi]|uniref:GNAT family N-acetyltransferase n=1 Tax=Streptococcus zalophi TaxID=640031 RepID=UPI00215BEF33|nr:GNAT family N-acetyltransferase [Streptococcus zalophi]MCR8968231.1 GNAT family N-acetyltransferase [Streptococcus zalophi]
MTFLINTDRLIIKALDESFFEEYKKEFNDDITKLQWPESFDSLDSAKEILNQFISDMNEEKMYELVLLDRSGEFVGSVEVFDIKTKTPVLGIWIKKSKQGLGYAYEALRALIDYLNNLEKYDYYIYDVDVRNISSIRLVEKFNFEKKKYEEVETPSKKKLYLQTYFIFS